MPTVISHAVVGVSLGYTLYPEKKGWKFFFLALLCSVLPDFDAITFKLGIKYNSLFGHRGFSHSILFAIIMGLLLVLIFYRNQLKMKKYLMLFTICFLIIVSHALLDGMTTGGLGVGLFSPFNNERYFLPWRFIKVSPIGLKRFLTQRGVLIMKNEITYLWIPSLTILFIVTTFRLILRKYRKNSSRG